MVYDFRAGDRVRVAERWATFPDRPSGVVKRVWVSARGGQWVSVLFDGHGEERACMARELERL